MDCLLQCNFKYIKIASHYQYQNSQTLYFIITSQLHLISQHVYISKCLLYYNQIINHKKKNFNKRLLNYAEICKTIHEKLLSSKMEYCYVQNILTYDYIL